MRVEGTWRRMKKFEVLKAMAAAACLAAAAGAVLLVIRPGAPLPSAGELPVFRVEHATRLTSENLVDLLQSETFGASIRRAEWNGAALSVDLAASPSAGSQEAVFRDLKRLIGLAFTRTTNVDRLLVRFVETASSMEQRHTLLLASDVRRSDHWLTAEWERLERADLQRDAAWRQRLRLTHTTRWVDRFGPFERAADGRPRS